MEKRNILIKALFVIGVIAIVIMVVFGLLKVIPKIVSSLASAGSAIGNNTFSQESLNINTSRNELNSGDTFSLSFEHINPSDNEGLYALTYECEESTSFQVVGANGAQQTLLCRKPFTLSSEPISLEMIGTLSERNSIRDATLVVSFTPNDERTPTVRGEKIVTIQNSGQGDLANESVTITTDYQSLNDSDPAINENNSDNSPVTPTTQPPASNNGGGNGGAVNSTPTTPVFRAPADLAISNVRSNGTRVQFTVSNIGGQPTGVWSFNYTLPTSPITTQNSGQQISLNPGESLGFTLDVNDTRGFTSGVVSIFVDPFNQTVESSTANNNGVTSISFSNNNGGGGVFNPNDDADLVIIDAEVGYISGNRFIEDDSIDEDDEAAIQFTVRNEGGENTGTWRFEVDLPTTDNENFRSSRQANLVPGASITFTLEFDNLDRGNNQDIDIEIDSDDDVDEENERNNRRSLDIDIR